MPSTPHTSSIDSVLRILQEGQPWFPLALYRGDIAEIRFDSDREEEAEALAQEFKEHGFEAEVHHTFALSAHGSHFLQVAVDAVGAWAVGRVLDGTVLPGWRWLVDRLRSVTGGGVHVHQALLFQERVRPWLDARFGQGAWSYNPDSLECCKLGSHTVLRLIEERTGAEIVLDVQGLDGPIDEIPFSRTNQEK